MSRKAGRGIGVVAGVLMVAIMSGGASHAQEVVARLDGEPITRNALYNEMLLESGRRTFLRLLGRRLVERELARQGIVIPQERIDAVYAEKEEEFRRENGGEASLAETLRTRYGASVAEYKEKVIRYDLALKRLLENELSPDKRDLFNYFFSHREQYRRPARARIRHILIDPLGLMEARPGAVRRRVTQAEWKKALEAAQAVRRRIRSGEAFEAIAAEVSHEDVPTPGAAAWVERGGALHKGLEAAIFSLEPGETTEPVKTIHGYHIVLVEASEPARELRYTEVKDRVAKDYRRHMTMVNSAQYLQELRRRAEAAGRLVVLIEGF